jgi:uncharacterized Ntn-hydrolase superfamily protein
MFPVFDYSHTGGRCSITGGYVYRGSQGALPDGTYIYGDFCTGEIFSWNGSVKTLELDTNLSISSFGEDEAGEMYVVPFYVLRKTEPEVLEWRRRIPMTRRPPAASLFAVVAVLCSVPAMAQQRAPDGVPLNDEGNPQYSTFSLCAIDPATGQSGAAVTTRVPFVGRAVPHVRAKVGAVCTQASTMVEYGPRGLDLLAKGVAPQDVLKQLLENDAQRESRQVGVIDMQGRSAAHTGKNNGNWAGSKQGLNYTVQANIMVGPEVVEAVAASFESTEGSGWPLAERMILALEAGQAKGGDRRWGSLQSAAIKIADPNNPGRGGDYIALAIEVGEHPEPVAEMKRIYYTTARRLGYRNFSRIDGADVVELKRMLHALGYWRPTAAVFPEPASMNTDKMRELQKTNPTEYEKLAAQTQQASRDLQRYDDETIAAVDKFRADRNLNYQGNPAGLVDQRLVDALRAAYVQKKKGG